MNFLNLACGQVDCPDPAWTNLDFASNGDGVRAHNLLTPLPFEPASFDLVYCSHFLEHLPRAAVAGFLHQCLQVIKPGGILRLVVPDCEEMFTTYLQLRSRGLHGEANFLVMEIVDQCVRTQRNGEMGRFYGRVDRMPKDQRQAWFDFIRMRTGQDLSEPGFFSNDSKTNFKLRDIPVVCRGVFHRLGIRMLLAPFRDQNVSFALVGERHHWLWDFYQLQEALEAAGFVAVKKMTHDTSLCADFPFYPLDCGLDGQPRKGLQSLFVEALKPQR
jgi:predicted SAM-dependent methyltransferase